MQHRLPQRDRRHLRPGGVTGANARPIETHQRELKRLKSLNAELDLAARILVRKDIDLSHANQRLKGLNLDLQRAAQLLVRRDLELSSANERLRELDRTKSEFVSIVAHQLRTPLSAVKWVLKMLLDGDAGALAAEQQSLLGKGYESNERMIRLVNDMLDVVRIESGKVTYHFAPVQLADLAQDLLLDFIGPIKKKNLTLAFDTPTTKLPQVLADAEKIRTALQNLIDNAIRYTPAKGAITLRLQPVGRQVWVTVSDTGIGVPQHQHHQLFSRFFRGDNAIKMATDGSGLGLFIARSIIEKHHGRIWFESRENDGSSFHFTLPRA